MKLRILFAIVILSILGMQYGVAQVHNGDLIIYYQATLNKIDYTKVNGSITIYGDNRNRITDLSPLSRLKEVTGDIKIFYTSITSLAGLDNLRTVGGAMEITFNNSLTSISSTKLQNVGSLYIHNNPQLTQVNLNTLLVVSNTFAEVSNNNSLQSLELPELTTIKKDLRIFSNHSLDAIDMSKLHTVSGTLRIHDNSALGSCCTLSKFW